MIRATRKDKNTVIDILVSAFEDNQSVNYLIRQDDKRQQRIRSLMDYSFEVCYSSGDVFLSKDGKGCALLLYPHKTKTDYRSIWLDVKLVFSSIGISRLAKALKRENRIKAKQPKLPMAYLWFLGVNPFYQHQDIGSNLLKQVLIYAKETGLPVYLETSTESNLPWYKKHGFTAYDGLNLGFILNFLKYEHTI